ncbi:hypothetical protein [Vibrio phage H188]|nr:hypothetical protein [Vibrio phage H188]
MSYGILVKGGCPFTMTQCTINGKFRGVSTHYAPLSSFTKRFVARCKYGI